MRSTSSCTSRGARRRPAAARFPWSLALWAICVLAAPARAQWTGDGLAVTRAPGDQSTPTVVTDLAGGVFVAWNDARTESTGTWLQHLLADGSRDLAWPPSGRRVSAGPLTCVVSDGAGGALVVTSDPPYGRSQLRHVDAGGTVLGPWLSYSTSDGPWWNWVPDGCGGLLAIHHSFYGIEHHIDQVNRFSHLGGHLWYGPGIDNQTQFSSFMKGTLLQVATDGRGGAWVVEAFDTLLASGWQESLRMMRCDSTGAPPAGWGPAPPGIFVLGAGQAIGEVAPAMAASAGGGVVQLWSTTEAVPGVRAIRGTYVDPHGQMRDGSGTSVPVRMLVPADADRALVGLVPRSGGGAISLWSEPGFGLRLLVVDSLAAKITSRIVGDASDASAGAAIVPDGTGGACLAWAEWRPALGRWAVVAQRVDRDGAFDAAWGTEGRAVCTPTDPPAGLRGGMTGGDLVIAWADARRAASEPAAGTDVYLARVQMDGVVSTRIALVWAAASGDSVALAWFAADAGARVSVQRSADGAAWTTLGERHADGLGRIAWTERGLAPGSRWAFRLADADGTPLTEVAWAQLPAPARAGLTRLGANPVQAEPRFAVTLAPDAPGAFDVLDVQGRSVMHRVLEPGAAPRVVTWTRAGGARAGVYFARLVQGRTILTARFVVLD